ncbi:21677_t:CDS:2, partial [Gigaspora rosea]
PEYNTFNQLSLMQIEAYDRGIYNNNTEINKLLEYDKSNFSIPYSQFEETLFLKKWSLIIAT